MRATDGSNDGAEADADLTVEELRRVIEHQVALFESSDRGFRQVVRFALLMLTAFTTLVAYGMRSLNEARLTPLLVFGTVGTGFVVSAIVAASTKSMTKVYGGFGDAPDFRLVDVPGTELEPADLETAVARQGERARETLRKVEPRPEGFRAQLLHDYQRGVRHNNVESVYRTIIERRALYLLVVGAAVFGAGVAVTLANGRLRTAYLALAVVATLAGVGLLANTGHWTCRFVARNDERMDYGHYDPRNGEHAFLWACRRLSIRGRSLETGERSSSTDDVTDE